MNIKAIGHMNSKQRCLAIGIE